MTPPATIVRTATLLDFISVVEAMRGTSRGQADLEAFAQVAAPVNERLICQIMLGSLGTVALTTLEEPGRALVVAGFMPQGHGVLRTWMLATDEAWAHGGELTKYTEVGIGLQLEQGAHRIETICPDSHTAAKAWYPRLGLKQEATLAKFCADGSDAVLFVRLRGTT